MNPRALSIELTMAATVYIVLALCALANGAFLRRPHLDGRIVGGVGTEIENYPYQVSLLKYGSHVCGGAIISEKWGLTAAHCISGTSGKSMSIRAGSSISNSGGTVHQIARVIKHEKYIGNTMDYDFALLEVQTPFSLGNGVQPVKLADDEPAAGEISVISGWGAAYSGSTLTTKLQVVTVPIVGRAKCNNNYISYGGISARMICAGLDEGGKDACQGDSGGPLVVGGKLAGVVSWGAGCAKPRYPGVYSNVANQRVWIKNNTGI